MKDKNVTTIFFLVGGIYFLTIDHKSAFRGSGSASNNGSTTSSVEIILYIMYYYLSYLTSVDLMYAQTSVSCRSDPRLFCGIN